MHWLGWPGLAETVRCWEPSVGLKPFRGLPTPALRHNFSVCVLRPRSFRSWAPVCRSTTVVRASDFAKEETNMGRIPGFTAEAALLERAQRHYGAAGIARSSWSVKPAFDSGLGRLPRGSGINPFESLLCCLNCSKQGGQCFPEPGGCLCLPQTPPKRAHPCATGWTPCYLSFSPKVVQCCPPGTQCCIPPGSGLPLGCYERKWCAF